MDRSLVSPPLELEATRYTLRMFDARGTERLAALGTGVRRYGLVALLLFWGGFNFTEFEAQAIRPLLEHHPLLSPLVTALGLRGTSNLIGSVEVCAAALIALRRLRPLLSAVGSLIAVFTFLVTLSFLITTPGVLAIDNPVGGFLMKDITLLGAALATAALAAASPAARATPEAELARLLETARELGLEERAAWTALSGAAHPLALARAKSVLASWACCCRG
jgi:reactive chlorine resistance protein C